jgi:hypothetical protein
MILISSNLLSIATTTVTFTIPTDFFGVELRICGRTTAGGYYTSPLTLTINGGTPTGVQGRAMRHYPSGTFGGYTIGDNVGMVNIGGTLCTTSASYFRLYGVQSSLNKAFETFNYPEANIAGGDSFTLGIGGVFSSSTSITTFALTPSSGYGNFESGTRFDLYGIK